jgi:hypothetical protein
MTAVHPTKSRGNASKNIDYLLLSLLLSFKTHVIASVARLQREEMSRAKKEHGGTGTFSTGFYKELASSLNLQTI